MAKLLILPWDMDAPCHTYECYGRIAWKLVPEAMQEHSGAVIHGLCDDCRQALLQGEAKVPVVGWPEVDKFLREHRGEEIARQLVEGAMGMYLVSPGKEIEKADGPPICPYCDKTFQGNAAKANLERHKATCPLRPTPPDG